MYNRKLKPSSSGVVLFGFKLNVFECGLNIFFAILIDTDVPKSAQQTCVAYVEKQTDRKATTALDTIMKFHKLKEAISIR